MQASPNYIICIHFIRINMVVVLLQKLLVLVLVNLNRNGLTKRMLCTYTMYTTPSTLVFQVATGI